MARAPIRLELTAPTLTRRHLLQGATLGGGALLILPAAARAETDLTPDAVYRDPDQPVLGNPKGSVTIAEFFDYQCPFCKKNAPILEAFVKADPEVRLVAKDWPIFGPPSVYASHLVLGASAFGQYATAHRALMATKGRLTLAEIDKTLAAAGVDPARAKAAYEAARPKWDGLLARNAAQAAGLGLQGTPAFVIGTVIYPGALDAQALKQAVLRARA